MKYLFPLVATNRDGKTRIFNDADSFRKFAFDRTNGGVGAYWMEARDFFGKTTNLFRIHHESTIRDRWYRSAVKNAWIVRDDRGRPVDKNEFIVQDNRSYNYRWSEERQQAADLGLPIPGTGKRRKRKCHCIEVCGGNHRDARYASETPEVNAEQNDFEGL